MMKIAPWLKRAMVAVCVVSLLGATAVAAWLHEGVPAHEVSIDDGGVWVSHEGLNLVGHLNYASRVLDAGVSVSAGAQDIAHTGVDVAVLNRSRREIRQLDTAAMTSSHPAHLADTLTVNLGAKLASIVDATSGRLWAVEIARLGEFRKDWPALGDFGAGAQASPTDLGSILVVTSEGEATAWERAGDQWSSQRRGKLRDFSAQGGWQLSAVGNEPVALFGSTISTLKTSAGLAGQDWQLQRPGPASDVVAVVNPTRWQRVTLDDGQTTQEGQVGKGVPADPVVVGDCAYFGWTGSATVVTSCAQAKPRTTSAIAGLEAGKSQFRTHRDKVVLNNVTTGDVFLVNEGLQRISSWQDALAQARESSKSAASRDSDKTVQAIRQSEEKNRPPVAVNDSFGVRPGRSTLLPVTANDVDPDGDVLVATATSKPALGEVRSAGGPNLEYTAAPDATGPTNFTYAVDDGRGGRATAQVQLKVQPWSANDKPKPRRDTNVEVAVGAQASTHVLADWIDPDGDSLTLVNVTAPQPLEVTHRPDGLTTVRASTDARPGLYDGVATVSDGRVTATAPVRIEVKSAANVAPQTNPDQVRAVVKRQVMVDPLRNDSDANGDALSIVAVNGAEGVAATISPDGQRLLLTADREGTSYVGYTVSDGFLTAASTIRVDVVGDDAGASPIALPDVVHADGNGSTICDPLGNDVDPGGRLLIITGVVLPPEGIVDVDIVDNARLRIRTSAAMRDPALLTYRISNGSSEATGSVTVLPPLPQQGARIPRAQDDRAVVHVGDSVDVDVVRNDLAEGPLKLLSMLQVNPATSGIATVVGNKVRFRSAGGFKGVADVTYTVESASGHFSSAVAHIQVLHGTTNAAPSPPPVLARTLAGRTVAIPVPLDGIDPDGDSVSLEAIDSPPGLGAATVKAGVIEYRASAGSTGTDTFSYRVRDARGALASAQVSIGVGPASTINRAPKALPDFLVVRPGRDISLPVAANDVDPDADPLRVLSDIRPHTRSEPAARIVEGRLLLRTPQTAGILRYDYGVSDSHGGQQRGTATIEVRDDAPLLPPVARDDVVEPTDRDSVDVAVLANDVDPDGTSLKISVEAESGATLNPDGTIHVPLTDTPRAIDYTVTDVDGLSAHAAVRVPARFKAPLSLRADKVPLKITAGQNLTVPLADIVESTSGRPRITYADRVKAAAGLEPGHLVKDPHTLLVAARKDFAGMTSISLEVSDGPGSRNGGTQTLTLPVLVQPKAPRIDVVPTDIAVPLDGEFARVEVAELIRTPGVPAPTSVAVSLGNVPAGVDVTQQGSVLSLRATKDQGLGSSLALPLTVSALGVTTSATLPLKIVSTLRPAPTARRALLSVKPGQGARINIADYVSNPYADQNKPLRLLDRPHVGAGGSAKADGLTLTVTPEPDFRGELTATYRVGDATMDAARVEAGDVKVAVRDRPAPPTGVWARVVDSGDVQLSWVMGENNGEPVTDFVVRWASGSKSCGAVTSCRIEGLQRNASYRFTVTAVNAVGMSDPSAPSNEVRPIPRPDPPTDLSLRAVNGNLNAAWSAGGPSVRAWQVQLRTAGQQQASVETSTPTYSWSSLAVGVAYEFRVRALAPSTVPSDWSVWSSPVTLVGLPLAPGSLSVAKEPPSALEPSLNVSWQAPDGRGDKALHYQVRLKSTGQTWESGTSSIRLTLPPQTGDQIFDVRARNSAGWGPWSAPSAPVRAFKPPSMPPNLKASATGVAHQIRVSFEAAQAPGVRPSEIRYVLRSSAGGSLAVSPGEQVLTNAAMFPHDVDVTLTVTATATVLGEAIVGPAATAVVRPHGPPGPVTLTAQGSNTEPTLIVVSWNVGAGETGITGVQLDIDGKVSMVAPSGRQNLSGARGQVVSVRARAHNASGQWGPWANASARTWGEWSFSTDQAVAVDCGNKDILPLCSPARVSLANWEPNSTVYCGGPDPVSGNWRDTPVGVDAQGRADATVKTPVRSSTATEDIKRFSCSRSERT